MLVGSVHRQQEARTRRSGAAPISRDGGGTRARPIRSVCAQTPPSGIGKQLFGHACANGGVVLKPGKGVNKLLCAHEKDHGAYCGEFCPRALDLFSGRVGVPEDMQPPWCAQAWAPADVHVYLRRATDAYRADHGWGHYNEVCPAPPPQLLACLQPFPYASPAQLRSIVACPAS